MDSYDIIRKFNSYKALERSIPANIVNLPFIKILDSAPVCKVLVESSIPLERLSYSEN